MVVALAAPLQAGTISVNSVADEPPADDAFITLREALLIARGDRLPFDDPDPTVLDERQRVTDGAFGAGVADTIRLSSAIVGGTIALTDYLPPLDDSTDAIDAPFGAVTISGAALPADPVRSAFDLTTDGHSIRGRFAGPLAFVDFPVDTFIISGSNNSLSALIIQGRADRGRDGVVLGGGTGNAVGACIIRDHPRDAVSIRGGSAHSVGGCTIRDNAGHGVLLTDGAAGHTLNDLTIHGNGGDGIVMTGPGTEGNSVLACYIGITDAASGRQRAGNGGYGVRIEGGASNNRLGPAAAPTRFSQISNNQAGGILIEGAGTDGNILHSLRLGWDASQPAGVGNGTGNGIEVRGGAKKNAIGQPSPLGFLDILGHVANGILIHGVGTDGNNVQFAFIVRSGLHGVAIADGVQDTFIGGQAEGTGVDIDFAGEPGAAPGHAVFLFGNNPNVPLRNISLGFFHFGFARTQAPGPVFTGDGIHVTGHVDTLVIGGPGHPNDVLGAAGYGVVLDGPDVRNVTMFQLHVGNSFGFKAPNELGGILIRNGARDITLSGPGDNQRSFIAGNNGPGILIDGTGSAPQNVTILNTFIGLDGGLFLSPNKGDGIVVRGDPNATSPTAIDVHIGRAEQTGLGNVIAANAGNGILLDRVSGVRVLANRIGTRPDGTSDGNHGNGQNGILLVGCEEIDIGTEAVDDAGNVISGSGAAGLRFLDGTHTVRVHQNLIGTNGAGDAAVANTEAGIVVEAPGPPTGAMLTIGGPNETVWPAPPFRRAKAGNVISGNDGPGILVTGPAESKGDIQGIEIVGNLIGTSRAGDAAVPNTGPGVRIEGPRVTGIGLGTAIRDLANIISGNGSNGVEIDGASGWTIVFNVIGLNARRTAALPNGANGVLLANTRQGRLGLAPDEQNTIAGNTEAGVFITNEVVGDVRISNNRIGTGDDGMTAFPNQDGIVIRAPIGQGGEVLTIGGINSAIADKRPNDLGNGNLISGNTRDGIRVEAPGTAGDPPVFGLEISGNLIGVALDGKTALPNGEAGVRLSGGAVLRTRIGSLASQSRINIISGNGKSGVVIEAGASRTEVVGNRLGPGIDPKRHEAPNTEHGIAILDGAVESHIEKNVIKFNGEHGIFVSGAATRRHTFTDNSIHRNEKEGIRLADGANDGIAAPTLDRIQIQGKSTDQLDGKTGVPGGTLELFVDPPPRADKRGYYGQGETLVKSLTTDGNGAFIIPLNFNHRGIITTTVTDAQGNTSEFSPFMSALVVQVVHTDENLLVANKPTVVRVYADTGVGYERRMVGGMLHIDGVPAAAPRPDPFEMRPVFGYGDFSQRALARNTMNFYVRHPSAGAHRLSATLTEGGIERGRLDAGQFVFQELNPLLMLVVPVVAPRLDGAGDQGPDLSAILEILDYFVSVYPLDPQAFRSLSTVLPFDLHLPFRPHNRFAWVALIGTLNQMGIGPIGQTAAGLLGFGPLRVVGVVSDQVELGGPYGMFLPAFPNTVAIQDRFRFDGAPTGNALAHEIGHSFNFGDTYEGGLQWPFAGNPLPADPAQFDANGIFIFEDEHPFDPTHQFTPIPGMDGPLFSDRLTTARRVYEFMGNERIAWVNRHMYRLLFEKLGGSLTPGAAPAVAPGGAPATADPALIVGGMLRDNGTGTLSRVHRPVGPRARVETLPAAVTYVAELQDALGTVLDSAAVSVDLQLETLGEDEATGEPFGRYEPVSEIPFQVVLQDHPMAHQVVLKDGGTVLAQIVASATTPAVTLDAPHGPGALPEPEVKVSWTASDPDPGDDARLVFTVLYTPDDGVTKLPLGADLVGVNSLTVPTGSLPAGSGPRFIVRASDGWHEVEDASDPPLIVTDRPPFVRITRPASTDDLRGDLIVALGGTALDAEDGILIDAALAWHLDDEPVPFATGSSEVVSLPAGAHTLRLTATDSAGQQATDAVTVQVRAAPGFADADEDNDVDLTDLATLQDCMTGPISPPFDLALVPCMRAFDGDGSETLDLRDWVDFQNAFTGSKQERTLRTASNSESPSRSGLRSLKN